MNRGAFESLDREGLLGVALAQAEAIERLSANVGALRAEIAELWAKLGRPPKTPDNSSVPPSQGHKPTTELVKNRRKEKAHPGAHRPLHPNPTQRRDVLASACGHCGYYGDTPVFYYGDTPVFTNSRISAMLRR